MPRWRICFSRQLIAATLAGLISSALPCLQPNSLSMLPSRAFLGSSTPGKLAIYLHIECISLVLAGSCPPMRGRGDDGQRTLVGNVATLYRRGSRSGRRDSLRTGQAAVEEAKVQVSQTSLPCQSYSETVASSSSPLMSCSLRQVPTRALRAPVQYYTS